VVEPKFRFAAPWSRKKYFRLRNTAWNKLRVISYLFRGEVDESNKSAQSRPHQQADLPVEQGSSQALVDPVNLKETMSQNVHGFFAIIFSPEYKS
jgi:hypothetical protein